MARRKALKQTKPSETIFRKHRIIFFCLAVTLIFTGAILAKRAITWFSAKPASTALQGQSLLPSNPSIEYVQAGGRLVASERPSGGGAFTNNASFVSQSVPTTMTTGQAYNVSVTMNNNGTSTWTPGTHRLGSQNPQNNTTWGLSRADLSSSVSPGSNYTFNFTVTAPSTAATYNFQWRMLQEGGGFFGAISTNVSVTVSSGGGGGTFNAMFVSQVVPSTMSAGQSYSVSVTMKNNGTSVWNYPTPGDFSLSSQNPADNTTWGLNRVDLTAAIAINKTHMFSFTVTAPPTPGVPLCQYG